ncbi:AraD1 family protein [Pokkaliibacter sp. CJK22405]|uniref:AraD1 family protein n=1 Tax=Pokkaliibacter sp. CJK22405 TaxID=3384615 RepID=UPI003984B5AA
MFVSQLIGGGVIFRDERAARIVEQVETTFDLAQRAIAEGNTLMAQIDKLGLGREVDLEALAKEGRLDCPIRHPEPARLWLTGTGLTHLGSAATRDAMHAKPSDEASLSDSMKMFRMGLEGGKPAAGETGVQPEWFYKGNGATLVAPGQPLHSPGFALDSGEEPEMAGIYLIGTNGTPYRLGFALANEFSDHVTERINYLYLAHSKLRPASVGPEMRIGDLPADIQGTSRILREGKVLWEKPFVTGEANMSHTLRNLEYHHFKYRLFCQPGDVHIHMFGTATLSFADGIKAEAGDVFEISAPAFGTALRNPLTAEALHAVEVISL